MVEAIHVRKFRSESEASPTPHRVKPVTASLDLLFPRNANSNVSCDYVASYGGSDPRKNIARLVRVWRAVASELPNPSKGFRPGKPRVFVESADSRYGPDRQPRLPDRFPTHGSLSGGTGLRVPVTV